MQGFGNPSKYTVYIIALLVALVVLTTTIYLIKPSINFDNIENTTTPLGPKYQLDFNSIPSIINGITSSTSIIIGFTGAIIGILYQFFETQEDKNSLLLIAFYELIPLVLLLNVYFLLIFGLVNWAIKFALFAFSFSLFNIALALVSSFYKLAKRENNHENSGKNTENSNKCEKNNSRNNFVELGDDFQDCISTEDLRILLKQRLDNLSKFLTTSVTISVSIIISFVTIFYGLPEILNVQFPDFLLSVVGILMMIIFVVLTVIIVSYSRRLENKENEIMRQYSFALKKLKNEEESS